MWHLIKQLGFKYGQLIEWHPTWWRFLLPAFFTRYPSESHVTIMLLKWKLFSLNLSSSYLTFISSSYFLEFPIHIPPVDNLGQTWLSCYFMAWTWCTIVTMTWSSLFHDMFAKVSMDDTMIIPWSSWEKSWSCYGDHGQYCYVVWTLIIQPTLINGVQVVVHYFFTRNMLEEPIRNYPRGVHKNGSLSQKI